MKRLIYMLAMAAALVTACDAIDEADRLEYIKPEPSGRCVLIEDFTGQNCVNCPTATDIIAQLQHDLGHDTVIAVAIHSGSLGVMPSERHPDGLATELGNTYYNYWSIDYQPMGVIDRSDGKLDKDWWTYKVIYDLTKPSTVNILVETAYTDDAGQRQLDVDVDVVGATGTTDGKLQLWLTEDSIVAFQQMPNGGGVKQDYVHNHVLRDALNGTWGEDVTVAEGAVKHFSHSYRVNPAWRPENMAVVAFVYNADGVVQVTRKPLR